MFECTFEGCDKAFATEPKRRGHLSTHKTKKRGPGVTKRFYRKKYDKNPSQGGLPLKGLPPSHRRPALNKVEHEVLLEVLG